MTHRLLPCALLVLAACEGPREYEFCALLPPSREYNLRVLPGETEAELIFEWDGGPVHELYVMNRRQRWLWDSQCSEQDDENLQAPCVTSPVVFPLAEARPDLVSGESYQVRSATWCAMGGDEIQQRFRTEDFVAP
jgi:hypothetical protein